MAIGVCGATQTGLARSRGSARPVRTSAVTTPPLGRYVLRNTWVTSWGGALYLRLGCAIDIFSSRSMLGSDGYFWEKEGCTLPDIFQGRVNIVQTDGFGKKRGSCDGTLRR